MLSSPVRAVHVAETAPAEHMNLWSSILNSVQSTRAITTRNLVVLGEPGSGKSTLISAIASQSPTGLVTGADGQVSELALSYAYFDVGDEKDKEETVARVGVYTLPSSQPAYTNLLPLAFPATGTATAEKHASTSAHARASMDTLKDTLIVLLLDWQQPWTFLEQLRNWLSTLHDMIDTASDHGLTSSRADWSSSRALLDEMKQRLTLTLANYKEPSASGTAQESGALSVQLEGDEAEALTEGMLTDNWGVPIVVVCTKADAIPRLERDKDFKEEHFDYIQQVLRTVCMKYGAGLFYASSQRPQSMEVVRSYILHRLFSSSAAFPFAYRASTTDRDTLLVPAGWDSWGKIRAIRDPFDCHAMGRGWTHDCKIDQLRRSRNLPRTTAIEDELDKELLHDQAPAADTLSAIKLYEDIVSDWHAGSNVKEANTRVKVPDEQAFLAVHHAALAKEVDSRAAAAAAASGAGAMGKLGKSTGGGVVGPMSSSSRGLPSVEKLMSRANEANEDDTNLRPNVSRTDSTPTASSKREYTAAAAAAAAAMAGLNERGNSKPSSPAIVSPSAGASSAGSAPKQSEVLHSFFQSLLKDKGSSGAAAAASPKAADRLRTASSSRRDPPP